MSQKEGSVTDELETQIAPEQRIPPSPQRLVGDTSHDEFELRIDKFYVSVLTMLLLKQLYPTNFFETREHQKSCAKLLLAITGNIHFIARYCYINDRLWFQYSFNIVCSIQL
jgi:hypothetical protein